MFINSIHLLHSHRAGEFESREIIYLALFSSFQTFIFLRTRALTAEFLQLACACVCVQKGRSD